jgi:hypothetical protein
MTTIVAGAIVYDLNVPLPRNGVFLWQVTNPAGNWADGESIELRFYSVNPASTDDPTATAWAATMTGPTASWLVAKADVQAVIDAGLVYASLYYIDPSGNEVVWAEGRTNVY